jgi:hypothetical protein
MVEHYKNWAQWLPTAGIPDFWVIKNFSKYVIKKIIYTFT